MSFSHHDDLVKFVQGNQAHLDFGNLHFRRIKHGSAFVYSYDTLIASFDNVECHFNDTKYSITTSKHQNTVRRAAALLGFMLVPLY